MQEKDKTGRRLLKVAIVFFCLAPVCLAFVVPPEICEALSKPRGLREMAVIGIVFESLLLVGTSGLFVWVLRDIVRTWND